MTGAAVNALATTQPAVAHPQPACVPAARSGLSGSPPPAGSCAPASPPAPAGGSDGSIHLLTGLASAHHSTAHGTCDTAPPVRALQPCHGTVGAMAAAHPASHPVTRLLHHLHFQDELLLAVPQLRYVGGVEALAGAAHRPRRRAAGLRVVKQRRGVGRLLGQCWIGFSWCRASGAGRGQPRSPARWGWRRRWRGRRCLPPLPSPCRRGR